MVYSNFLHHYQGVSELRNKQLIPNFKTISLFKATNDEHRNVDNKPSQTLVNQISLETYLEQVVKLKFTLRNTECILLACERGKIRLLNALVNIDQNGEFLTSAININTIPKTLFVTTFRKTRKAYRKQFGNL